MLARNLFYYLAQATCVSAHGYVKNIIVNGVSYAGYDVTTAPYQSDPPIVVGWGTTATDLGFVAPSAFGSSDIICHRGSTNAKGHATVAAGDEVFFQWTTWPESHKGPVLSYLAACGDSGCESVNKTELEFFKIDEKGLIDGSTAPGTYAADELEDNGQGWLSKIPTNIKPGFYVLRHEIIALHSAGNSDGAQNYPQCFNLEITGSGTEEPTGTLGVALYNADDAGILVNIYTTTNTYAIPGPTLISGAITVAQSTSAAKLTGTATTGTSKATTATADTSILATGITATLSDGGIDSSAISDTSTVTRVANTVSPSTTFSTATRTTENSSGRGNENGHIDTTATTANNATACISVTVTVTATATATETVTI